MSGYAFYVQFENKEVLSCYVSLESDAEPDKLQEIVKSALEKSSAIREIKKEKDGYIYIDKDKKTVDISNLRKNETIKKITTVKGKHLEEKVKRKTVTEIKNKLQTKNLSANFFFKHVWLPMKAFFLYLGQQSESSLGAKSLRKLLAAEQPKDHKTFRHLLKAEKRLLKRLHSTTEMLSSLESSIENNKLLEKSIKEKKPELLLRKILDDLGKNATAELASGMYDKEGNYQPFTLSIEKDNESQYMLSFCGIETKKSSPYLLQTKKSLTSQELELTLKALVSLSSPPDTTTTPSKKEVAKGAVFIESAFKEIGKTGSKITLPVESLLPSQHLQRVLMTISGSEMKEERPQISTFNPIELMHKLKKQDKKDKDHLALAVYREKLTLYQQSAKELEPKEQKAVLAQLQTLENQLKITLGDDLVTSLDTLAFDALSAEQTSKTTCSPLDLPQQEKKRKKSLEQQDQVAQKLEQLSLHFEKNNTTDATTTAQELVKTVNQLLEKKHYEKALELSEVILMSFPVPSTDNSSFWSKLSTPEQRKTWLKLTDSLAQFQWEASLRLHKTYITPGQALSMMNSRLIILKIMRAKQDRKLEKVTANLTQFKEIFDFDLHLRFGSDPTLFKKVKQMKDFIDSEKKDREEIRLDSFVSPNAKNDDAYCLQHDDEIIRKYGDPNTVFDDLDPEKPKYLPEELIYLRKNTAFFQMMLRPEVSLGLHFGSGRNLRTEGRAVQWSIHLQEQAAIKSKGDEARARELLTELAYEQVYTKIDQMQGRLSLSSDEYYFDYPAPLERSKPAKTLCILSKNEKLFYLPWGPALPHELSHLVQRLPDDSRGKSLIGSYPKAWDDSLGTNDQSTVRVSLDPPPKKTHLAITKKPMQQTYQDQTVYTEPTLLSRCLVDQTSHNPLLDYVMSTLEVNASLQKMDVAKMSSIEGFQLLLSRPNWLDDPDVTRYLDLFFLNTERLEKLQENQKLLTEVRLALKLCIEKQLETQHPKRAAYLMHLSAQLNTLLNTPKLLPDFSTEYHVGEDPQTGEKLLLPHQAEPEVAFYLFENTLRKLSIAPKEHLKALGGAAVYELLQQRHRLSLEWSTLGTPMAHMALKNFFNHKLKPKIDDLLREDRDFQKQFLAKAFSFTEERLDRIEYDPSLDRLTCGNYSYALQTETLYESNIAKQKELPTPLPETLKQLFPQLRTWFKDKPLHTVRTSSEDGASWIYSFQHQGIAFSVVQDKETLEAKLTCHFNNEEYIWVPQQGKNYEGIESILNTSGLWLHKKENKEFSGLVIPATHPNFTQEELFFINVNKNGVMQSMQTVDGHTMVNPSKEEASIFPTHKNLLRKITKNGAELLHLLDKDLYFKKKEDTWVLQSDPNFVVERTLGDTELEKTLTSSLILKLRDKTSGQYKLLIWQKNVSRHPDGRIEIHTPDSLEQAKLIPFYTIGASENMQSLKGSKSAFLYLATVASQKKHYALAHQLLELAQKEKKDPSMTQILLLKRQLFSIEPKSMRGAAVFLKASLALLNYERELLGRSGFSPEATEEHFKQVQKIVDAYKIYKTKEGTSSRQLEEHNLSADEKESLGRYERQLVNKLIEEAVAKEVKTPSPVEHLELLPQILQGSLPREFLITILVLAKDHKEQDATTLPVPLTARSLLENFFTYLTLANENKLPLEDFLTPLPPPTPQSAHENKDLIYEYGKLARVLLLQIQRQEKKEENNLAGQINPIQETRKKVKQSLNVSLVKTLLNFSNDGLTDKNAQSALEKLNTLLEEYLVLPSLTTKIDKPVFILEKENDSFIQKKYTDKELQEIKPLGKDEIAKNQIPKIIDKLTERLELNTQQKELLQESISDIKEKAILQSDLISRFQMALSFSIEESLLEKEVLSKIEELENQPFIPPPKIEPVALPPSLQSPSSSQEAKKFFNFKESDDPVIEAEFAQFRQSEPEAQRKLTPQPETKSTYSEEDSKSRLDEIQANFLDQVRKKTISSEHLTKMLNSPHLYGDNDLMEELIHLYQSNNLAMSNNDNEKQMTLWLLHATSLQHSGKANFDRYFTKDGDLLTPKSIYKKILAAEYHQKKIMRPAQIEAIFAFYQNPNQLKSIKMGVGKTSIIMPVIASLIAERNELPIMLTTPELESLTLEQFDRVTRETYGRLGYPFHLENDKLHSLAYLADLYLQLLNTKHEKGYIVTNIQELANLQNTLQELIQKRHKLLKNIDAPETVQKLNLLERQLTYLRKISLLFDSSQIFADEYDSIFHVAKNINKGSGQQKKLDQLVVEEAFALTSELSKLDLNDPSLTPDVKELVTALQNGTQAALRNVNEKTIPALIEHMITHKLNGFSDLAWNDENKQELIDYFSGQLEEKLPSGFSAWEGTDKQKKYATLKNLLSTTLPTVLGASPGLDVVFSQEKGYLIVPADGSGKEDGDRFSKPHEIALFNFIGWMQSGLFATPPEQFTTFLRKTLKEMETTDPKAFNTLLRSVNKKDVTSAVEELATNKQYRPLRLQLLKDHVFDKGLIRQYSEQIKTPVSRCVTNKDKFGGVTGTKDFYLSPQYKEEMDDPTELTRLVEAEVFLANLHMLEKADQEIQEKFLNNLQPFEDSEDPTPLFSEILKDEKTSMIINEGGYGVMGKTDREWVASLRALSDGKKKNFVFFETDEKSKATSIYLWKTGEKEPVVTSYKELDEMKEKWIACFGPRFCRGADLPAKEGHTHYLPGKVLQRQTVVQSIMRGRGTGTIQTPLWHLPKSVFGSEPLSFQQAVQQVITTTIEGQKPLHLQAQTTRIEELVATGLKIALNSETLTSKVEWKTYETMLALAVYDDRLQLFFKDYSIEENTIDFAADYNPTSHIDTITYVKMKYEAEEKKLSEKLQRLDTVLENSLKALCQQAGVEENKVEHFMQAYKQNPSFLEKIKGIEQLVPNNPAIGPALQQVVANHNKAKAAIQKVQGKLTKDKETFLANTEKHKKYLPKTTTTTSARGNASKEKEQQKEKVRVQEKQRTLQKKGGDAEAPSHHFYTPMTFNQKLKTFVEQLKHPLSKFFPQIHLTPEGKTILDHFEQQDGLPVWKFYVHPDGTTTILSKNDYYISSKRVFDDKEKTQTIIEGQFITPSLFGDVVIETIGSKPLDKGAELNILMAKVLIGYKNFSEEEETTFMTYYNALSPVEQNELKEKAKKHKYTLPFPSND